MSSFKSSQKFSHPYWQDFINSIRQSFFGQFSQLENHWYFYFTCMPREKQCIFNIPAQNIFHKISYKWKSQSAKGIYFILLTMPEKLPRRSTFLPSLSINIVATTDPSTKNTVKRMFDLTLKIFKKDTWDKAINTK